MHAHRAEANAERLHLTRFAGLDRREHQAGENFLEEAVEFRASHPALQLQPLNTGGHEPLAPVPRLQLPQPLPAEDHFVLEKRERWQLTASVNEAIELFERAVNGPFLDGCLGIERHHAERMRERIEESDRVAHLVCADTACRSSI